ncbi:MAG: hypothetical protein Q9220_003230 [cf. Caloplaca sp. 1 TL-2023]
MASKLSIVKERERVHEANVQNQQQEVSLLKLKESTFKGSPQDSKQLQIEDMEVAIIEQKLNIEWLDIEHDKDCIDEGVYHEARETTYERISILNDEILHKRRELRFLMEQSGQLVAPRPDTGSAFVAAFAQLLYDDPKQVYDEVNQLKLREAVKEQYQSCADAPHKDYAWCPISKDYFSTDDMTVAHIVPQNLGATVINHIFGAGSSLRINTTQNCLLVHKTVARNLDRGNFVLMSTDPNEPQPIKRWKIQITNDASTHATMGRKILSELTGTEVEFKSDTRPASEFLYYHFVVTLLRNKQDRRPGWAKYLAELPIQWPFTTSRSDFRHSTLMVLAEQIGEINDDATEPPREKAGEVFAGSEELDEDKFAYYTEDEGI